MWSLWNQTFELHQKTIQVFLEIPSLVRTLCTSGTYVKHRQWKPVAKNEAQTRAEISNNI